MCVFVVMFCVCVTDCGLLLAEGCLGVVCVFFVLLLFVGIFYGIVVNA